MDEKQTDGNNASIFAVEPTDYIIPLEFDVEHTPLTHDNYKVYNIGRAEVYVELLEGTCSRWQKIIDEITIKPGQTVIFDNVRSMLGVYGLRISNKTDIRAVVCCVHADCNFRGLELNVPSKIDRDYRETYSIGVRYIPYRSKNYQGLYDAFWPSNKLNVWEQILLKLQPLLKNEILQTICVTVKELMKNIQQKLHTLSIVFDKGLPIFDIYMEISEDLREFEKRVIKENCHFKCNTTNMLLLPLFSNFTLFKTTFYTLGIVTSSDIGFSFNDITQIQNYLKATKEATKYITSLLDNCLDDVYSNSFQENLYNSMMNVRSYINIHGTEYTRTWDSMALSPFTGENVFYDVISYSNFFGRQTPNLIREATAKKMYPPLTPYYLGFIYNYLTSIEVHLWVNRSFPDLPKIGGMNLVFADYSSYFMGTKTELIERIDFMKAHITKLQVTGTGAIDSCTFHMSDGRELFFGTRENDSEEETFEVKDHRIVSIFLSSDDDSLEGQAANIAVSYRLNSIWE